MMTFPALTIAREQSRWGHPGEVLADASKVVLIALGPMVASNFLGAKKDILCVCLTCTHLMIRKMCVRKIYIHISYD